MQGLEQHGPFKGENNSTNPPEQDLVVDTLDKDFNVLKM